MPYNLTYESRPGYLFVLMEGPETYASAMLFWQMLFKKSIEEEIKCFLIVDKVDGRLTTVQLFSVSEMVASLFHDKVIAYVDPKDSTYQDNQLGETVVRSRGGDATVFRTEAEAVSYLKKRLESL